MVIWFVVASVVIVAEVFRSPLVDYRLVALGALLPLVDLVVPLALHTLLAPVVMLTVVMVATPRRRLLRRRLLGVPIGAFLHLVLDATWTSTALFWWPLLGFELDRADVPEWSRNPWLGVTLELVGVGLGVWAWRRYGLTDGENRRVLIRRGHLARSVFAPRS